jgi:glycosyltransferase involved in cell wall biosynthesis
MNKKPLFTIIIPVRVATDYLRETQKHLSLQTYKSFELLVITDKISHDPNPAKKRNLGAKMAKGKYLAFLDDDSYPDKNWLKYAASILEKSPDYAAVCGPCLTPPSDNLRRQASGLVWSSFLGSGGAGSYRNHISSARFVDDYPSVNLIVKKTSFDKVGGFNTHHWPGEDTILCLDLVYKLHQKIYYHPSIIVYHHRREVITAHLKQITRYALHRGNFARIYPKTSLTLGYIMPTACVIYFLLSPLLISLIHTYYFIPFVVYFFLLLVTFTKFLIDHQSFFASLLAIISIPITHIYYGILFIIGFFTRNLDFVPHKINDQGYIGG